MKSKIELGVVGLMLAGFVAIPAAMRATTFQGNVPCELIRVETVVQNQRGKYMVFCQDETFVFADDWATGSFRASDAYGQLAALPQGSSVLLDVWGIRSGFFSTTRTAFRFHVVSGEE